MAWIVHSWSVDRLLSRFPLAEVTILDGPDEFQSLRFSGQPDDLVDSPLLPSNTSCAKCSRRPAFMENFGSSAIDHPSVVTLPPTLAALGLSRLSTEARLDACLSWRDYFRVISARLARATDLSSILELFAASEVSRAIQPLERAESIWLDTLERPGVDVFVSDGGSRVAATCMLITAPNLLRQGRSHGFLENVVTHPDFRGLGHGSAVVRADSASRKG